jgi:hypothetical protein
MVLSFALCQHPCTCFLWCSLIVRHSGVPRGVFLSYTRREAAVPRWPRVSGWCVAGFFRPCMLLTDALMTCTRALPCTAPAGSIGPVKCNVFSRCVCEHGCKSPNNFAPIPVRGCTCLALGICSWAVSSSRAPMRSFSPADADRNPTVLLDPVPGRHVGTWHVAELYVPCVWFARIFSVTAIRIGLGFVLTESRVLCNPLSQNMKRRMRIRDKAGNRARRGRTNSNTSSYEMKHQAG